jgi:hypothetical protein
MMAESTNRPGYPLSDLMALPDASHLLAADGLAFTREWTALVNSLERHGVEEVAQQGVSGDFEAVRSAFRHRRAMLRGIHNRIITTHYRGDAIVGVDEQGGSNVRLANFDGRLSLSIPDYCYRAFVTDVDMMVAIQIRDELSSHGGTYIAVVRDDTVMAAIHAKAESIASVMEAVESQLLPVAVSDYP